MIVQIQQLAELEEIIAIRSGRADETRTDLIHKLWKRRLAGVEVPCWGFIGFLLLLMMMLVVVVVVDVMF